MWVCIRHDLFPFGFQMSSIFHLFKVFADWKCEAGLCLKRTTGGSQALFIPPSDKILSIVRFFMQIDNRKTKQFGVIINYISVENHTNLFNDVFQIQP